MPFNTFKKTTAFLIGALVLSLVLSPVFVLAEEQAAQILAADFCKRFPEIEEKIISDVASKEATIAATRTESEQLLQDKWAKENDERASAWKAEDTKYADLFASLDKEVSSSMMAAVAGAPEDTAKKEGVETFKKAIETATSDFRSETNNIITTYQTGMEHAIAKRNEAVDSIIKDYKTGIADAIKSAKTDCASTKAPLKVRGVFKGALKDLEEKLKTDIKQTEKIEAEIETLGKIKKESLEKAEATFKSRIETAGLDLKKVIVEKSDDASSTPQQ